MRETGRYGTEAYLKKQVLAAGGATRKWVSPGHPSVPDQIVIWPAVGGAVIHFVEVKAPGKDAKAAQVREHKRLKALGCTVYVLNTKTKIDGYAWAHK